MTMKKIVNAILTCLVGLCISLVECTNPRQFNGHCDNVDNSNVRILNGQLADVKDLSFIVKIKVDFDVFTGSIIANEWVLTAGHCMYGLPCQRIKIFPAAWDPWKFVEPIKCIVHPQFNVSLLIGGVDLALLKLPENFEKNYLTGRIRLPVSSVSIVEGTRALIAGFGYANHETLSDYLLQAEVRIEIWSLCNSAFWNTEKEDSSLIVPVDLPKHIFCTIGQGSEPGGHCPGDSGGPVIVANSLAGVVSFIEGDGTICLPRTYSYHTRVVDHLSWINSHIDSD